MKAIFADFHIWKVNKEISKESIDLFIIRHFDSLKRCMTLLFEIGALFLF